MNAAEVGKTAPLSVKYCVESCAANKDKNISESLIY